MSPQWRTFLFSFQTKLVLSLTLVIMLAIFVAGAVFVWRTRDDRRGQALNRVAAASPSIYQQSFTALLPAELEERPYSQALDELAREQDVRILIVSPGSEVLYDTDGRLAGEMIPVPESTLGDRRRGFIAWEPGERFPEPDLTFVSASSRFQIAGRELPFRIIVAVESDTIADAWLGLLPSLTIAALIAVPLAWLTGFALARQVSKPVARLTAASEAMARGDFEQRVEVNRDDEVGRLARAFTSMSSRVARRDTQMRALLANVSHDLKTPMTSITGYAQALSDGTAAPEEARRIGEVIAGEAQHVNALLGDLLYLAEIDAGEVITRREDANVEDIAARCVRRIEPAAHAKGIALSVDVPAEATWRGVDPDKVERALTNVIENAAKFTPPGGEISVSAHQTNGATPAPAPAVVCVVSNSGSSIPDEDLPRIFDRFFRGDRTRRSSSGSGLGLAIARELVELNGGTIAAQSDAAGVRFEVALPG